MSLHIVMNQPDYPGGTPVSLVDGSTGRVVGDFASVVDASHAKSITDYNGEGASGAFDNVTSMPEGTPLQPQDQPPSDPSGGTPHPGWQDRDPRTPRPAAMGTGAVTSDPPYGEDPTLTGGAAGGIQTPGYTKTNTMPMIQVWEADPNATLNPIDLQPSATLTHPVWKYPHDVNP